jgi:hypothetical protein
VQSAALAALTLLAIALPFAPREGVVLLPLLIVLSGSLVWRFEGTHVREIALMQVPIGAVLIIAYLPSNLIITVVVDGLAIGLLAAVTFSEGFRRRWLALVAPGRYRVLPRDDQVAYVQLRDIYLAGRRAMKRARSTDGSRVASLLRDLERRARLVETAEPHWTSVRDDLVEFLHAMSESGDVGTAHRALVASTSAALAAREVPLR